MAPTRSLPTSGNVHAVTVEVAVLHDHVAEVEADSEHQSKVRRHGTIAHGHAALDVSRAPDRSDRTGELNEEAVSSGLDDSTCILGYSGINQLTPVRRQSGKRSVLVGTHESAKSRDVSHQNDA